MTKWACTVLALSLGASTMACSDDAATDDDDAPGGSTGTLGACCGSGGNGEGGAGAGNAGGDGPGGSAPLPCGAPETFETGLTPSAELHVAMNGSDGNDGSAGSPFATIAHAAEQATPGTAIVIHAGSYQADTYLSDFGGSEGAPIWIGGAEGEARPTITGGSNGFHLSRVRYLVLHDLDISGGDSNGINCDDGGDYANDQATHHVVFRGVSIHDIGTGGNNDCLKLSGVNDFWVVDSEFARCGGGMAGSGIDMVGCHDGVVAHSSFVEMSGNGVQTKGGSADVTISANVFTDAGERAVNIGGSTGFEFFRPPLSTSS
ncbi:MAG: right-handed parallel beta-helix repeat-containing protein, partial [Myxococcales bacterium]|nr:right-handed parallel beta-helix repeat-containing protein [Myxococcales bacterium]